MSFAYGNASLLIWRLKQDDAGEYICRVTAGKYEDQAKIELVVDSTISKGESRIRYSTVFIPGKQKDICLHNLDAITCCRRRVCLLIVTISDVLLPPWLRV